MKEEEAPRLKMVTALQCETTSDEDDDEDSNADGKTAVIFVNVYRLLVLIYTANVTMISDSRLVRKCLILIK